MNQKDIHSFTKPGYLTSIQIISSYQNLPSGFVWKNIPMFSVITGKNGTGKSNLLQGILFGFDIGFRKTLQTIKLNVQEGIEISQICSLQNTDKICSLRSNVEEDSKKAFNEKLTPLFEDLKKYTFFKQVGQPYELVFKEKKSFYDLIIQKAATSVKQQSAFGFSYYESELKKCFDKESEVHLADYNSLENTAKRVLESIFYEDSPYTREERIASLEKTLLKVNSYLEAKQFKYCFSEKSFHWNKNQGCFDTLELTFPQNNPLSTVPTSLGLGSLSSGEKLELLVLLWQYEQRIPFKNAILIMDEPDAHLHPGLVKEIIAIIQTKIIQEWGIQVIMTTHNPTTVSLVPKECLWVLQNDAPQHIPRISRVTSKKEAIQLLTSDFISVNEPFKLVFVEAETDKKFYQMIREKLIAEKVIYPNEQILFMAHSKNQKDSSCDLVKSIVENCVEHSGDEDKNLREHVFGIVDGDNKPKPSSPNIFATRRYSIENYIYDPIHIFFCIKNKGPGLASFKAVEEKIKNSLKAQGIPLDTIPSFDDIIHRKDKNIILQTIANSITEAVMSFFQEKLQSNDSQFDKIFERLNGDRFKHLVIETPVTTTTTTPTTTKTTLIPSTMITTGKKQLLQDKEEIQFIHGIQLTYPKFFLEIRGHDLEFIYSHFFSGKGCEEGKFINKDYIMNVICKHTMLIPQELADVFIDLQKPVKHLDHTKTQDLKKSETEIQLEKKIENLKKKPPVKMKQCN